MHGGSVQTEAALVSANAARGAATSLPSSSGGSSASASAKPLIGACGILFAMQCAISLPLAKTKSADSATQKSEAPSPISNTRRREFWARDARTHLQVPLATRQVAL